jgi:hypothetical protein
VHGRHRPDRLLPARLGRDLYGHEPRDQLLLERLGWDPHGRERRWRLSLERLDRDGHGRERHRRLLLASLRRDLHRQGWRYQVVPERLDFQRLFDEADELRGEPGLAVGMPFPAELGDAFHELVVRGTGGIDVGRQLGPPPSELRGLDARPVRKAHEERRRDISAPALDPAALPTEPAHPFSLGKSESGGKERALALPVPAGKTQR